MKQFNMHKRAIIVQKMRNDNSEITIRSDGSSMETPSSASNKVLHSNCIFYNCSFAWIGKKLFASFRR
jgi:hypothetical protein